MNTCIYCRRTSNETIFTAEEHIIPAGLGGKKALPAGIVCDICNNTFSQMELNLLRSSILSLPRQLFGPGRRGSLSAKKSTKSRIHMLRRPQDNEFELGYMSAGVPHIITQLRMEKGREIQLLVDPSAGHYQSQAQDFIERLRTFSGKYVPITDPDLPSDQAFLGLFKDQWFIACGTGLSVAIVNENARKLAHDGFNLSDFLDYRKSQVQSRQQLIVSPVDDFRMFAKMGFNLLADRRGASFVLDAAFDSVRDWIREGTGDNHFCHLVTLETGSQFSRFLELPFPPDSHKLFVFSQPKEMVAFMCFYGNNFPVAARYPGDPKFSCFDSFVCDWRNREEFSVADYLMQGPDWGG